MEIKKLWLTIIVLLFVSGCGGGKVTEVSPAITEKPVEIIPAPTQTPTPLELPHLAPSQTPVPSETSTGTALPTLSFVPTAVQQIVTYINPKDQAEIVYVPEGEFIMGENNPYGVNPEHLVSLDAFWIYKTEVTNAQFGRFVANTNYRTDREYAGTSMILAMHNMGPVEGAYWRNPGGPSTNINGRLNDPVVHISWNDAVAYCEWAGARLPTEAEWEKAARSGDKRVFPWGNNDEETYTCNAATYYCTSMGSILPVGSYPSGASPYGALDMIGNVAEWVWDFYADDYYSAAAGRNPTGPTEGDMHVFRGTAGSLFSKVSTFERNAGYPDEASQILGFRCASSGPDLASIAPKLTSTAQFAPTATRTPLPSITPSPTRVISIEPMEKVFIPAGEFTMGNDTGEVDEGPAHQVFLDGFYIDHHEVTNAMYELCVRAGICKPPRDGSSSTHPQYYDNPDFDTYPVIFVDWYMAETYCEWRQARLPTEAEWEKAARGTDGRQFPWGNDLLAGCEILNYKDCSTWDTLPAGSFAGNASVYGALDMSGNVWEWVSSVYRDYPYNESDGRESLDSEENRVFRGGSWSSPAERVTTTFRSWDAPSSAYNFLGFRCASTAP